MSQSLLTSAPTKGGVAATRFEGCDATLVVVVEEDAGAAYPVRIDPTFSDANWVSMNPSIPGTDGAVKAAVMDGAGNLYIGGSFAVAGNVVANNVAKWNGSGWSALGSGVNGEVDALAISGGALYAGGWFTTAGGNAANYIAEWDGSGWSALGPGMKGVVDALAMSGNTLYAGGYFTTAGGNDANYIAQWDGSSWSPLGSGMSSGSFLWNIRGCAGGVGRHAVCGRVVHNGGRQRRQLHRAMERERLVAAGFGHQRRRVCARGIGRHPVC